MTSGEPPRFRRAKPILAAGPASSTRNTAGRGASCALALCPTASRSDRAQPTYSAIGLQIVLRIVIQIVAIGLVVFAQVSDLIRRVGRVDSGVRKLILAQAGLHIGT